MEQTFLQSIVSPTIVTATFASNIIFLALVVTYNISPSFRGGVQSFLKKYITLTLFIITTTAVVGSLLYSNIVGFPPCELCWWARVLIYPQALLAGFALWRKDSTIVDTLLPLSVIGFLLTLYHSFVLWGGKSFLTCTQEGAACSKLYVMEYGYITIPVMALSCFVYLLAVSWVYKKAK